MGQAGSVIVFVFLYALFAIVATCVYAYVARCFLVVLEGTATGNDEVAWPDEPFLDWIWRGVTLAWLMLVWLAPLGVILKLSRPGIYREEPLLALLLAGGFLWLFFPLGILSSLSSTSRWMFFRWKVLTGLSKIAPTTLGFYAASLVVVLASLLAWYVGLRWSGWLILPAGVIGSAAILIYARLLGRVAWALVGLNPKRKKKRGPVEASALLPPPTPVGSKPQPVPVEAPAGEEGQVYRLGGDEPPAPDVEETPSHGQDGYELADREEEANRGASADEMMKPIQRRVERAQGRLQITKPPRSLWAGVYTFPFYDTSLSAWLKLAVLTAFAGGLLRLLLSSAL